MEVGYEYMCDLTPSYLVFGHLGLGSLSAINQEMILIHGDDLRRRMTVKSGKRGVVAENGYCEH